MIQGSLVIRFTIYLSNVNHHPGFIYLILQGGVSDIQD